MNNAGVALTNPAKGVREEDFDRTLAIDLKRPFFDRGEVIGGNVLKKNAFSRRSPYISVAEKVSIRINRRGCQSLKALGAGIRYAHGSFKRHGGVGYGAFVE